MDRWSDGIDDGCAVGIEEGVMDGSLDGIADGSVVGTKEGVLDGWSDGIADGNVVGKKEMSWMVHQMVSLMGLSWVLKKV